MSSDPPGSLTRAGLYTGSFFGSLSDHRPLVLGLKLWATTGPSYRTDYALSRPAVRGPELDLTNPDLLRDYQAYLLTTLPIDPPQGPTASDALHQLSRASAAWIDGRMARHCPPHRKRKYFDGWSPDAIALKANLSALPQIQGHLRGYRGHARWRRQDDMDRELPGILYQWQTIVLSLRWAAPGDPHRIMDCSGMGPSAWRTATLADIHHPHRCATLITKLKRMLHGRQRNLLRKQISVHAAHLENLRAQGRIGRVTPSSSSPSLFPARASSWTIGKYITWLPSISRNGTKVPRDRWSRGLRYPRTATGSSVTHSTAASPRTSASSSGQPSPIYRGSIRPAATSARSWPRLPHSANLTAPSTDTVGASHQGPRASHTIWSRDGPPPSVPSPTAAWWSYGASRSPHPGSSGADSARSLRTPRPRSPWMASGSSSSSRSSVNYGSVLSSHGSPGPGSATGSSRMLNMGSAPVAVRTRHSSSSSMPGSTRRRPLSRSTRPAGISAGHSTPSLGEPWSSVGHDSVSPLTLLTGWRPWTSVVQRPSAPPGHSRYGRGRPPPASERPPPSTGPVPSTESGAPPRRCL